MRADDHNFLQNGRSIFFITGLDSPNQLEAIWEFRFQAQALLADDLDAISSLS